MQIISRHKICHFVTSQIFFLSLFSYELRFGHFSLIFTINLPSCRSSIDHVFLCILYFTDTVKFPFLMGVSLLHLSVI